MLLTEHIDSLDKMVADHAATCEIRSQIAFIGREVAALEANYASLHSAHTELKELYEALRAEAQQDSVKFHDESMIVVTLRNGKTLTHPGNDYALLPSKNAPKVVEFRLLDKAKGVFTETGHAEWSQVAHVQKPA